MIPVPLSRRQSLLGAAAGAMIAPFLPARASPGARGEPVILTIDGLAGAPNRGPSDPMRDRLFDHNNLNFQKARSYSAGKLANLPPQNGGGRGQMVAFALLHRVSALTSRITAVIARGAVLKGVQTIQMLGDRPGSPQHRLPRDDDYIE